MIFEGLDGAFGRVNAVVVWLNEHVSFAFQKFELCFVRCEHSVLVETGDRETEDRVGFVVVYDEVAYIALEGHVGERPGEIIV